MPRFGLLCSFLITSTLLGGDLVSGAEFGRAEEARDMLSRAIKELKADKLGALAKFNHNDHQFRDRDLFVFCFNRSDGEITAHESFVGSNVRNLRDAAGYEIGENMYRNAKEGQITEMAFKSPVPGSTELAPKRAYVTAVADQICSVSSYRFTVSAGAK